MTRSSETVRVEKVSTIIVDNNNERPRSNENTHLRDTRFLLSYFLSFISFIFSSFFIPSSCWRRGNKMALLHWRKTDVPNRVRWGQWNHFILPLFVAFSPFFPFLEERASFDSKKQEEWSEKGWIFDALLRDASPRKKERSNGRYIGQWFSNFFFFFFHSFVMSQVCRVCATIFFFFFLYSPC